MEDATRPPSLHNGSPASAAVTERDIYAALMSDVDIDRLLSFIPPRPSWMARAACRGMGTRSFVPQVRTGKARQPASPFVRAMCSQCPVSTPCRDYALEHPELEGIWGGTDAYERRRLREQQTAT